MAPAPSKLKEQGLVDLWKSAENIEKSFVSGSSCNTYNHKLAMFMIWLFKTNQRYLEKSVVVKMKKKAKIDRENLRERGERNKRSTGEKKVFVDDHKELRNLCYELLSKVRPVCKGVYHNSPIKLEGKDSLSYFLIRDYMSSKKRNVGGLR